MNKQAWQGKSIAILGYGVEGKSSVNYFLRHGARVTVHDAKPEVQFSADLMAAERQRGVDFVLGEQAFGGLASYDLVMRTPTFPPHHSALVGLKPEQVSSQTNLFLAKWGHRTVGITGTKGKGTTATLLHHFLIAANKKVLLGGNIGVPLLDIIDDMSEEHIAIAELSSFQLWDATISPHWAILLMIAPEHLEQHGDLDDYLRAKQHLLLFQNSDDIAIILSDYHLTKHLANQLPAKQYRVTSGWVEEGAKIDHTEIVIRHPWQSFQLSLKSSSLVGEHNTANLAAAVLMAAELGVTSEIIINSLPSYQPLPHRLQKVASHGNVTFYDDSIATTPEATVAAINSFADPLVVILGGVNKQVDWTPVITAISAQHVSGCVLMGDEADRIESLLVQLPQPPQYTRATDYTEAIDWATNILANASTGIVLLSPGAKSFDQFLDYKDRGEKFQRAVAGFVTQASSD